MRLVAAVVFCLAGGVAAAGAQSISLPAEPAAAAPVVKPAEQQSTIPVAPAAKPTELSAEPTAVAPIEQAAKPAEQPAATLAKQDAAKAAEQPATKPIEQTAAKPTEQSAEPSAVAPIEQAAKPAEQPAATPAKQDATKAAEQPITKPVEQTAAKPDEQPAVKAVEQTNAKPDQRPPVEAVEQTGAIPTKQPAAQPTERQAAKPDEQPAAPSAATPPTQPVQHAALHPVDEPAYYPVEDPPAQPIEQAQAEACPGHPDAIGTSRVITISPSQYQLIGAIQYKQTLPLRDHEVVLTFDDGPIPPYTNSILDTLAANCAKATYFLVGEMAHARPYLVRRIYNEGHTIGTHSQHHPFGFERLSMQRVASEVEGGIASVDYALGNDAAVSPFFRIPGLGRTRAIEHFLESKGLTTWSADVDTDDWWRGTTPSQLIQRTMRRLNARGRGILLMHDIHPDTALALPALLKELKKSGYHIVQVRAAGERPKSLPQVAATASEMQVWPRVLHAQTEKTGAAMSALRHRVKTAIESRNHHRRSVRQRNVAKADPTGMDEQHKQF